MKQKGLEVEGKVVEVLPGGLFKVDIGGTFIEASLSGRMRINNIVVMLGDMVRVELTPYDMTKGRIVFRSLKKDQDESKTISKKDL